MITRPITRPVTSPIARPVNALVGAWNPRALFALGEQGWWFDNSDLSTLYQDAAGTIPVTAAGQPVGLQLDKSRGLVLGPELVSGYDSGYINDNQTTEPLTPPTGGELTSKWFPVVGGRTYKIAPVGGVSSRCRIQVKNASGVISYLSAYSRAAGAAAGVAVPLADSTQMRIYFRAASDTATGLSARELPGNHRFQATAASRPILRQNASTGAYYLEVDGSDDWMQTSAINFTGTDKVSLFTGVRKLSDAALMAIAEAGSGLDAISLLASSASGGVTRDSYYAAIDTLVINNVTVRPFAAPNSAVLSATLRRGAFAPSASMRVNGAVPQDSVVAGSGAAGNFGNYPAYFFRRGGTTLPFNGHEYGSICVGRLTTAAETRAVERLLARNTGVTLA